MLVVMLQARMPDDLDLLIVALLAGPCIILLGLLLYELIRAALF